MTTYEIQDVRNLITDYLEQRQRSLYYHKKKNDAEKEYNKLLAISGGEDKNFSLDEANKIYTAYQEMKISDQLSQEAATDFSNADEKLKELGQVLFHGTLTTEIVVPPVNGEMPSARQVTLTFPNGQVVIS